MFYRKPLDVREISEAPRLKKAWAITQPKRMVAKGDLAHIANRAKVKESFCESGEGVRLPREGADLRGSPENFRGSPGNFWGSLGNFR